MKSSLRGVVHVLGEHLHPRAGESAAPSDTERRVRGQITTSTDSKPAMLGSSSSTNPVASPTVLCIFQLAAIKPAAHAVAGHCPSHACLASSAPAILRATEIDADDVAHSREAAAASSRTTTSAAASTTIEAGTCGSGRAAGPNAAATAPAFLGAGDEETNAFGRCQRGDSQRHPRHERRPPRPLDADHEALALVQCVLVGKQRGGVAIGADAEQDEIEARRARLSELALVVAHGVIDPELSTDPPHIGP